MDFNTNIEILNEEEITFEVLKKDIENLLEENPNVSSIHKLCFEEIFNQKF